MIKVAILLGSLIGGCNKGSFGGGDSGNTVKTTLEVELLGKATPATEGRGAVVIKAANKLSVECLEPCPLKLQFAEREKDKGRFVYQAPFVYKIAGNQLAEGKTLECSVRIKVVNDKKKNDNKTKTLPIRFCPDRGTGRDCDTDKENMVKGCPI